MNEAENPFAALPALVDSLRAKACSVSPEAYRQHVAQTIIAEALRGWGFADRFRTQQPLSRLQAATLDTLRSKMLGAGAIIALVGERGLGKTTIAAAFALEQAWRNFEQARRDDHACDIRHVVYRKCSRLISRYKPLYADFGSTEIETLEESLKFLCTEQEYLVIDEVHDCDDQKMKARVLTDLIDRRYAARRDTILIANQTPADFASTIGDSILSRLGEHGAILPCTWGSFRTS